MLTRFWNYILNLFERLDGYSKKIAEEMPPQIGSTWKDPNYPSWEDDAVVEVTNAEPGWVQIKYKDGRKISLGTKMFKEHFVLVRGRFLD